MSAGWLMQAIVEYVASRDDVPVTAVHVLVTETDYTNRTAELDDRFALMRTDS